ncbi:MAG: hypothetical protein QM504_05680 [Pseudomonadota bacterium]
MKRQKRMEAMFKREINVYKCETGNVGEHKVNITKYDLPSDKGNILILEYFMQLHYNESILISVGVMGDNKKQLLKEFKSIVNSLKRV